MTFRDSIITATSSAAIFGSKILMGEYAFTVTFIKIAYTASLGVVDTQNKGESWKNYNYIWFINDGSCYVGNNYKKVMKGFKSGDKVTVAINLLKGEIQWRVG